MRVVSYGGGVQSTALLVLAAQGRIDYQTFLFANVGDDSEHPGTLRYVREIAVPFAQAHGLEIHELHRKRRDGSTETLFSQLTRSGSRSLPIPVRMAGDGAPGNRSCTGKFKIEVVGKWLKAHGAGPDNPATVAVGISLDEIQRVNSRKAAPYETLTYPLLDLAPPLRRADCTDVIRGAGLPVPGKSSCWFCPFHRAGTWQDMRRQEPALFGQAVALEALLNDRRDVLGKDHVFLTRYGKPLALAIAGGQGTLDGMDTDQHCDNGWCGT